MLTLEAEKLKVGKADINGICSTCNHLEDRLHRLRNGFVIWFCEEFDNYVSSPLRGHYSLLEPPASSSSKGEIMGLCINCENRETCVHTKTVGGVWHCEEYR